MMAHRLATLVIEWNGLIRLIIPDYQKLFRDFMSSYLPVLATVAVVTMLTFYALNWLFQRVVIAGLIILTLLLSGCTYNGPIPPTWKCHKAIKYAIYQSTACVEYEI